MIENPWDVFSSLSAELETHDTDLGKRERRDLGPWDGRVMAGNIFSFTGRFLWRTVVARSFRTGISTKKLFSISRGAVQARRLLQIITYL